MLDHAEPFSSGGPTVEGNLLTACNKCNGRKNNVPRNVYAALPKRKPIKGKYGEPQHWDGLSTLFVALAQRDPTGLTVSERQWLKALTATGDQR